MGEKSDIILSLLLIGLAIFYISWPFAAWNPIFFGTSLSNWIIIVPLLLIFLNSYGDLKALGRRVVHLYGEVRELNQQVMALNQVVASIVTLDVATLQQKFFDKNGVQ